MRNTFMDLGGQGRAKVFQLVRWSTGSRRFHAAQSSAPKRIGGNVDTKHGMEQIQNRASAHPRPGSVPVKRKNAIKVTPRQKEKIQKYLKEPIFKQSRIPRGTIDYIKLSRFSFDGQHFGYSHFAGVCFSVKSHSAELKCVKGSGWDKPHWRIVVEQGAKYNISQKYLYDSSMGIVAPHWRV